MHRVLLSRPLRVVVAFAMFGPAMLAGRSASATTASITVKPAVGPPGAKITVTGAGFGATETVSIQLDNVEFATAQTDGGGAFVATPLIPDTALPGAHEVEAVGQISTLQATAPFLIRSDWAMFRADARHSGESAPENLIDPGNVSTLVRRWSVPAADWAFPSPIVGGGLVYVVSFAGDLRALKPSNGHEVWSAQGGCCLVSTPAYAGGRVFWVTGLGALEARSAKTGAFLWSQPIEGDFASPVVSGKTVYVSDGTTVVARNTADGTQRWQRDLGAQVLSSPAVSGGRLFVGANDNRLHALKASNGHVLWAADTDGDVVSSPSVDGGTVVVGTLRALSAFDVTTGGPLWQSGTSGGSSLSSPAVSAGVAYVGSWEQSLVAVDITTGDTLWSGDTGGGVDSSPAVAGGLVFVGSHDHFLYAFQVGGCGQGFCDPLWTVDTGGDVRSSPAVADGVVYIGGGREYQAYALP